MSKEFLHKKTQSYSKHLFFIWGLDITFIYNKTNLYIIWPTQLLEIISFNF
jgi:hypothetical protein